MVFYKSCQRQQIFHGGLAQLGERLPCKQEVAGSIPTISTTSFEAGSEDLQDPEIWPQQRTEDCTLKTEQCIKVMKARQQRGLSRRLERRKVDFNCGQHLER